MAYRCDVYSCSKFWQFRLGQRVHSRAIYPVAIASAPDCLSCHGIFNGTNCPETQALGLETLVPRLMLNERTRPEHTCPYNQQQS